MNPQRIITIILCFLVSGHMLVSAQDMDTELSKLTEDLAGKIKDHGNKKVTVLDFTDLQGNSSELGKYISEQLTVDFVMTKRDFSVLDRANLKKILAEHKLTASGLVDPENAKKLGMFAGVDALIIGNIIPIGTNITLTVKIITTETAEVVGAAKAKFKSDETVRQFLSQPAQANGMTGGGGTLTSDEPKSVKKFGDLRVELPPLQIVNGSQYLLTMTLTNQNPKRSIWVALSLETMFQMKGRITDPAGNEFQADRMSVSGIQLNSYQQYAYPGAGFSPATEIPAGESISATVKFGSPNVREAKPGACRLQLEFLLSNNARANLTADSVHNLVCNINAN